MARRLRLNRKFWWKAAAIAAAPLCLLNLSIAFFGGSAVFPLSPFFVPEKAHALKLYAKHRFHCVWSGDADLDPIIKRAEKKYGLPSGLLASLVEVESEGRVHRISPAGAMGPGQLMPGTAELMNVEDPFDPETAIDGSARYLAEQYRARRDLRLAIASYNAGPGNVGSVVPRNGETEYYVTKVLAAYERRKRAGLRPTSIVEVKAMLRPRE
ncbi:MAG: lytic transglycosylase domain-containing protein [Myxococcaceae bacterium]